MLENQTDNSQEPETRKVDLNELSELDFGPSWTDDSARKKPLKEFSKQKPRGGKSTHGGKRDRRNNSGKSYSESGKEGKTHAGERKFRKKERPHTRNPSQHDHFQSPVKVDIYPQDNAFDALVKRLRSTVRTYQLFEIANLILEKPERYVIVVQNKTKEEEPPKQLYSCVPDHLPFETEDAAINHFLNKHLHSFFDIEMIEVEPPKGNFQMVNRCTITGELLGPPNYHRYQEFLQRHYASRIDAMSFDQFVSKVKSVKEQESIDEWVESMKKGFKYTLKEPSQGDEPKSFESLEAVRTFLLHNRKNEVVRSSEHVRFAGRDIEHLPKGTIRRSVETYIESQLLFPLDTANNIRGRLRRHHFTVYKKGSKGISYVCAVKRKFRDNKTAFTPSIQELIEFIEKNPNVSASKLPQLHLGIDTEKQTPVKLKMDESEVPGESTDAQSNTSHTIGENGAGEAHETAAIDKIKVAASTISATPKTELNENDLKTLNQLIMDLRWLVSEGYVTEYGDGSLFAAPPKPEPKQPAVKSLKASNEEEKAPLNDLEPPKIQ